MKKFLLVLLSIITIVIGVGCKENPDKKNEPVFPTEETDQVYMTVKLPSGDDIITYNISKESMYVNLRSFYGTESFVQWADEKIVNSIGRLGLIEILTNGDYRKIEETTYFDSVDKKEVDEKIESIKYPNGKDSYSAEELKKLEKDFKDALYSNGYRSDEEIYNYYKTVLAKEKLAKDYQDIYRSATDYTYGDYRDYYEENYYNEYQMFLIPFENVVSFSNTFKEINIKVKTEEGISRFVKDDTGELLTVNEIIEAYIKLYNKCNLFKESVSEASQIVEGTDYNLVNGKYQFVLAEDKLLYYDSSSIKQMTEKMQNFLASMTPYDSETSNNENPNWYTTSFEDSNGYYYTVLLLSKNEKKVYADVKAEIREELLVNEFTDSYVEGVMSTVRNKLDLDIRDEILYKAYAYEYTLSGECPHPSDTVVALFMNEILDKDAFFEIMDKRYGAVVATKLINEYNVLYDKNLNKIYDLTKEGTEEDRILDKKVWKEIVEEVKEFRTDFESGMWATQGYVIGYDFNKYLEEDYQVRNEKELYFWSLRKYIIGQYSEDTYSLANYDENTLYWKSFNQTMQKLADEYFSSAGIELKLTYFDGDGGFASPETWTAEQTTLVKEFYELIIKYFETYLLDETKDYEDAIEALKTSYNSAQFLIGENQSGSKFYGMDLAKYKTNGIVLVYGVESSYNKDSVSGHLAEVIKKIWDENPTSKETIVYGRDGEKYDYIVLEDGYCVYINVENSDMDRYEGRNVPTLEEIKLYIQNNSSPYLSTEQINMIKNYYATVYNNLIEAPIIYLELCKKQGNCEVHFAFDNYTDLEYQNTLSIVIETTKENYLDYEIENMPSIIIK